MRTPSLPAVLDSQPSAEQRPAGKDVSSCCRDGRVTPELATSWLGLPFRAGPFVSIRRVVEVSLDRGRRATQARGDLGDRQSLGLAEVARQCDGAAALHNTVVSLRGNVGSQ